MKKYLISFLILFLFFPSVVNAVSLEFDSSNDYTYQTTNNKSINVKEISENVFLNNHYSDKSIKKMVIMKVNDRQRLDTIFDTKLDTNVLWDIADSSILKIENGSIIGLKTGISEVIARNDLNTYYLHVTVINNPETLSTIYITVVVVLVISFITGVLLTIKEYKDSKTKKNVKEEEEEIEIL